MSAIEIGIGDAAGTSGDARTDMKVEVVVIPVSDAARAKEFYARLGWRLDRDFRFANGVRAIQFTPPGSECSVHFGTNQTQEPVDLGREGFITSAAPGSFKGYLIVSDIVAARNALVAGAIEVSEFFHVLGQSGVSPGLEPERRPYSSRVCFDDPDGNTRILQEITARLPELIDPSATSFGSESELASAMRRAAAAHGEYERRIGQKAPKWPDWCVAYIVAEAPGSALQVDGPVTKEQS
jgi:catechol 2,3-dioxygenase-like lactoylglutathione lyase family enzyme